jgi:hypothetical protein
LPYYEYQNKFSSADQNLLAKSNVLADLDNEYKKLTDENFELVLADRGVRYLIHDRNLNPEWDIDRFAKRKLYEKGSLALYAI